MNLAAYHAFTQNLEDRLKHEPRVLGLVALGSMAAQDYLPDRWSDHDFFVLVVPGAAEPMRADLEWLPAAERIVLTLRETAHGLKVLYDDGHLVEFAVFTLDELYLARINRYRILFDRGDVTQHLERIAADTIHNSRLSDVSDQFHFGQFVTNLLVGARRYARGERLSAQQLIRSDALRHLLLLLEKHRASPDARLLDTLDPTRRFELAFPALGDALHDILAQDTPTVATRLLALAQRELPEVLHQYPAHVLEVLHGQLVQASTSH